MTVLQQLKLEEVAGGGGGGWEGAESCWLVWGKFMEHWRSFLLFSL